MPPPSISNTLLAQYDASSLGLSNGDPVATWPDDSASNFDLTQATGGSRPSYVTGAAPTGLPGVQFDLGEFMERVSGSTVFPATKTVFFATKNPPNNTNHSRWSITDDDGGGRGFYAMFHCGIAQWLFGGSVAAGSSSPSPTTPSSVTTSTGRSSSNRPLPSSDSTAPKSCRGTSPT